MNFHTPQVGIQIGIITLKNHWTSTKAEYRESRDPGIPVLGLYPRDTHADILLITFVVAKNYKRSKCPSAVEWINTV